MICERKGRTHDQTQTYFCEEVRRITEVELEEQSGRRYFLVKDGGQWDSNEYSSPKTVVLGYDSGGNEVVRLEITEGNFSGFG